MRSRIYLYLTNTHAALYYSKSTIRCACVKPHFRFPSHLTFVSALGGWEEGFGRRSQPYVTVPRGEEANKRRQCAPNDISNFVCKVEGAYS